MDEVERHVGMPLEPTVVPGFVGVEVVENDMDGFIGPSGEMSFMKSRNSMRRRRFL